MVDFSAGETLHVHWLAYRGVVSNLDVAVGVGHVEPAAKLFFGHLFGHGRFFPLVFGADCPFSAV
jgi:hypothetical protein